MKMKRIFTKGEKYRPIVTIAKEKRGTPTVIEVSGRRYVYEHPDQFKGMQYNPNKKKKKRKTK